MAKHILVGLTALGLLATAFSGVSAQESPPPPASIGVVDLDLVGAKFERKIQEEERLTEWYRQEQQRLEQFSSFLFVSEEEWKEVVEIHRSAKNAWTEAQQKRVQTLKEQSTKWERDFRDLEAKPDRNDDEQNRLNLIGEIARSRQGDRQQLAVGVERELRQRQGDLGVALMEPVQAAVNQVATEKGLALVIEKRWVYFGGEDITEAVIALVNAAGAATAQPEPGGADGTEKPEGADSETPPATEGDSQ